jgi:hypothetical protein
MNSARYAGAIGPVRAATKLPLIVACRRRGKPFMETKPRFGGAFSCVVCRAETRTLREWYYSPMWVTVCFRAAGSQMRVT